MSILGLIAAFGGGVFAAAIGAVPAFIMDRYIFKFFTSCFFCLFYNIFSCYIISRMKKSMRTPLNPQYQCFLFLLTDSPVL